MISLIETVRRTVTVNDSRSKVHAPSLRGSERNDPRNVMNIGSTNVETMFMLVPLIWVNISLNGGFWCFWSTSCPFAGQWSEGLSGLKRLNSVKHDLVLDFFKVKVVSKIIIMNNLFYNVDIYKMVHFTVTKKIKNYMLNITNKFCIFYLILMELKEKTIKTNNKVAILFMNYSTKFMKYNIYNKKYLHSFKFFTPCYVNQMSCPDRNIVLARFIHYFVHSHIHYIKRQKQNHYFVVHISQDKKVMSGRQRKSSKRQSNLLKIKPLTAANLDKEDSEDILNSTIINLHLGLENTSKYKIYTCYKHKCIYIPYYFFIVLADTSSSSNTTSPEVITVTNSVEKSLENIGSSTIKDPISVLQHKTNLTLPKATMAIPGNTDNESIMFLYHEDHPNTILSEENLTGLKSFIQQCNKEVIMDEDSEFAPRYSLSLEMQSCLKIKCADQDTKQWLLNNCFPKFSGSFRFIVHDKKWTQTTKLIKCTIRIAKRESKLSFKEFKTYLAKQNKGLKVDNMEYYGKTELEDGKNLLIWFGMDEEALSYLKERNGLVYFDLEKTKIKWPGYENEARTQKKIKLDHIG